MNAVPARILIVDDDEVSCQLFAEVLEADKGERMAEVVADSEIVAVANGSKPYRDVGRMLKSGQVLVDLVHAVDPRSVTHGEYHGLAW